ncbi:MAG: PilZ domain-containing protein [Candidatus Korobacteraceae bacterium]
MDDMRAHERVYLPPDAEVYVSSESMEMLAPVRVIGLGGLFFQTLTSNFSIGSEIVITLHDRPQGTIHRLETAVRNVNTIGVGIAFLHLSSGAVAEVQALVSRYS